ncbi:hypothetical protein SDC9_134298 [bioreactor metagenome]|uniref:Uncharacterized protein n=1 Tax=bioreactor metagenome TaxID=1076179 RepID=A0A645DCT4_9ZZZZ
MEDRNVQHLFQAAFDFEAARRTDILQVDAAEGRCDGSNVRDDFFNILRIQGNRNGIHIPEAFEQGRFAFHNRNGCFRSDIAQAQDSRSVGYDGDQVLFSGISIDGFFVVRDFHADGCDARCIGDAQIFHCFDRHF